MMVKTSGLKISRIKHGAHSPHVRHHIAVQSPVKAWCYIPHFLRGWCFDVCEIRKDSCNRHRYRNKERLNKQMSRGFSASVHRLKILDIIIAMIIHKINSGGNAHRKMPGITNHNGRSLLFI